MLSSSPTPSASVFGENVGCSAGRCAVVSRCLIPVVLAMVYCGEQSKVQSKTFNNTSATPFNVRVWKSVPTPRSPSSFPWSFLAISLLQFSQSRNSFRISNSHRAVQTAPKNAFFTSARLDTAGSHPNFVLAVPLLQVQHTLYQLHYPSTRVVLNAIYGMVSAKTSSAPCTVTASCLP